MTQKPIDYVPIPKLAPGEKPDPIVLEIRKLLREEWSILGDCMMIRTTFKKQKKTPFTLICYFVMMAISFVLLYNSSYKLLDISG